MEFIPFNGSLIEERRLIEPFAPRVFCGKDTAKLDAREWGDISGVTLFGLRGRGEEEEYSLHIHENVSC